MINISPVDRFTLVHAGIGAIYGKLGLSLPVVLGLAIGFELIERPLKRAAPDWFPHPEADSVANKVGDTLAVVAGWQLGRTR